MATLMDTINAILRRSGIDPNAGARPYAPPPEDFTSSQQQPPTSTTELGPGAVPQATVPPPEAPAPAQTGPAYDPTLPYRADTKDDLERFENTRKQFETDLQELFRIRGEAGKARAAATTNAERQRATDEYTAADEAVRQMQGAIAAQDTRIAAEKNRRRDEKTAEEAKEPKPKNGDDRWVPIETTDAQGRKVRGVGQEVYTNGVWKYQPGSAKADTGFGSGPQGPGTPPSVVTDGRGTYWTVDLQTGKATAISGPQAAAKTITDPDGNIWLQNPDGTKGSKLFDAAPKTLTDNGRIIGYDPRGGQVIFNVDTKTPEGRALADRLERANVATAERQADPQFASAIAQYRAEAQRRQGLARTELARLQDLQKSGQLSPEMAEKQFDTWMQTNVEGPLAGFKEAAEQERRKLEQENLTRQTAEESRVETANRERGRLAFEADTAGRAISREIAQRTRAPEFIQDLGGLAASLGQGKTDFQFRPESFDPANFKKALPNMDELADKAVQRLFSFVPEARARNVNVPVPEMPTGDNLKNMMDGVRYSGPLTGTPAGEQPLPGQGAVDLKDQGQPGRARTVYSNGRYLDWDIPTTSSGQIAQLAVGAPSPGMAAPAPAAPSLPGQLPGETEEQRQARWKAIMSR